MSHKSEDFEKRRAGIEARHKQRVRLIGWLKTPSAPVEVDDANLLVSLLEKQDKEDALPEKIKWDSRVLRQADPDCDHYVIAKMSGVGCLKCNGWYDDSPCKTTELFSTIFNKPLKIYLLDRSI